MEKKEKRIFLDYASITPVNSRVEDEMKKVQKKFWANPSSLHSEGEEAKNVLGEVRVNIARILHCRASEVFFTSGGTESLNMGILGVIKSAIKSKIFPHIITSTIEHPAVLGPVKFLLENKEAEISFVSPDQNGRINPESIKKEIKENTVLVVIQHANNEIGIVQPIAKISKIIRNFRQESRIQNPESSNFPYLLVDASQSILYENVSLERLGADLLVLDGIKMYGPRGVGILAVKHATGIEPIIFGGGQEGGLRSGTENVAGAVGFAKALEIAVKMRGKESSRLTKLRDYAIWKILREIPQLRQGSAGQANISLNGSLENRLPNNINICLASPKHPAEAGLLKIDSEFLVIKLDTLGFAVSAASACHTLSSPTPRGRGADQSVGFENGSYVIESVSGKGCASSSLRITLGRSTKKSDLDSLISALKKIVK